MSRKEIQNRRNVFPEMRYTHEEHEAIDRVCANSKKYNYIKLNTIMVRIMIQNAPSNELKNTDKDYLEYLASL